MAEEEDDVIEDDVILQEGDVPLAGQESTLATASTSSSSSSEALPLSYQEATVVQWPSAGSVDAQVPAGGYTRASRSSLESTLDSIDAVPGYGRRTPKTALHLHHPYATTTNNNTSSSSTGSTSSSITGPPGSSEGLSSGNTADPADVDTGPYAKYHAAKQQRQQQQQQQQQQVMPLQQQQQQQQRLQEQQQWQPSSLSSGNFTEDDQQQQQQQQSAEGVSGVGFMVSGWSSLDTLDTLDSMDALPGYGSLPHSTTLGTADSSSRSSGGMAGSIDSSATAAATAAAAAAAAAAVESGSAASPSAAVYDALGNSNNGFVAPPAPATAPAAAAPPPAAAGVSPLSGRTTPYGSFTPIGASPVLGSVLDDVTPLGEAAGVLSRPPSSAVPDTYPSHSSFNYVPQVIESGPGCMSPG
jgi:hypothetical protein